MYLRLCQTNKKHINTALMAVG